MARQAAWVLLLMGLAARPRGHSAASPYCDPGGLAAVQCPGVEHGVDWKVFLSEACEHCPLSKVCDWQGGSGLLRGLATQVCMSFSEFSCLPGLLAANIVLAQFYVVDTPPDVVALLEQSASLAPFPFEPSQLSLYRNMLPAYLNLCDGTLEGEMVNVYVPKAFLDDMKVCGLRFTDEQLARRCRSRRATMGVRERRLGLLDTIRCPSARIDLEDELSSKLAKYSDRARSLQCQDPRGMWHRPMAEVHKCILVSVAHYLGFRPGQLVLDWGSGCGHKLSWAKMLFDVDGMGLDIEGGAVDWARQHSAGKFCHADGRDIHWIPNGLFDHVISYAALYHLDKYDQCLTGIQLMEKLRVGGQAFFGWNHDANMSYSEWWSCFNGHTEELAERGSPLRVEMEAVEDGFLFPPSPRLANETFLFQYPAYSVFLRRVA